MDRSLIISLKEAARKLGGELLSENDADQLIQKLASDFGFDLKNRYLWETENKTELKEYGADLNAWKIEMQNHLPAFDSTIYLVATDDEFFPWPIFKCRKDHLIAIVKEHRFFEYFVFDESGDKVLFDTHENALILVTQHN